MKPEDIYFISIFAMAKSRSQSRSGQVVNTTSTLSIGDVIIEKPSTLQDDWKVIKEDKYRPNRDKYVLDKFLSEYTSISLPGSDDTEKARMIYNLASRNAAIEEWLGDVNLEYALQEQAPTYVREFVSPDVYDKASKVVAKIKENQRNRAAEEKAASDDYKLRMSNIATKYDVESNRMSNADKVVKIINLKSTELPLSIHLAIETYNPANTTTAPNKRTYGREMLIQYKIALLKKLKADPDCDINSIIASNQTK